MSRVCNEDDSLVQSSKLNAKRTAKLPKSQQPKAKRALQEIWMAETKAAAELAFDAFIESYTPKYEKAADCLSA